MIEEIKPNFFIKQNKDGSYSRMYPIKKDFDKPLGLHNIRWVMLTANWKKALIMLIIILIAAYGYWHDTQVCRAFQENPYEYCARLPVLMGGTTGLDEDIIANISQNLNNTQQRLPTK